MSNEIGNSLGFISRNGQKNNLKNYRRENEYSQRFEPKLMMSEIKKLLGNDVSLHNALAEGVLFPGFLYE